ncbi:MAG TPA: ribosomal RNA small subunit methyltransferase A, partial [Polyangiaceae bacterium]
TPTFRALVKGAFSQRRKTLKNAWSSLDDRGSVQTAARRANVDLGRRGETLEVGDFARMAREMDAE